MVACSVPMLDAGYLMLDIQQCTEVEILKIWYPGTGIQNQSMLRTVFASTVYILYMI